MATRHVFQPVQYEVLNAWQKENYNYAKASSLLADYGFVTLRLSDDWKGADFIAQHVDGETILRVQLKSRLTFNKKYRGKDLWVAFCAARQWYLFPHDELLDKVLQEKRMGDTLSWERGGYSFPRLGQVLPTRRVAFVWTVLGRMPILHANTSCWTRASNFRCIRMMPIATVRQ